MANHRKHTRRAFDVPVEIVFVGELRPGVSVNISRGGIFVMTEPLPEYGERLLLRLRLPGVPEECEIPCVVRWVRAGEGAGMQFEVLRPIEIWALGKLLG